AHREGKIQSGSARSDDAGSERGRGSQSNQERSGQERYLGRHDQCRHGRRQGFAMHRARRRRLSTEAVQPDDPARADRGHVAQAFTASAGERIYLGKIENEKRHSETLLRNILPAEVATRLRNGESNIADHFDDATVIFADVVGFGKITARMKAYEIVACLNQLFSEFDRLAEDAGIEKIKTIGDNYMAVSGVPTPRANHARMAAKFALDTVAATARLRSRLPVPISIRVGLHSGPVMAGVIGTRKFAYDVWGDTVNIAARLEAASEPNRVLASAATVKGLGSDYSFDGPHKIDNKEDRVLEAFFLNPRP